ncbi:hypothetical protein ACWGRZ_23555, partial [Streptomyces sp. NPDC055681]
GVTADELIRQLARAEPPGRPVVVVSTDREVAVRSARPTSARAAPTTSSPATPAPPRPAPPAAPGNRLSSGPPAPG